MPRTRIAHTRGDWLRFAQSVTPETTAGHAFLEYSRAKLQHFIEEVDRLEVERDFHNARKLEATRRRNEMIEEGRRLVTAMRNVLKEHMGIDNERLAEFGIQPFRVRKRAKKPAESAPPPAESEENPQT